MAGRPQRHYLVRRSGQSGVSVTQQCGLPPGLSELRLRTDELATFELAASSVFVVENEVTHLAFPHVPDSIVVFGSGFGLTVLNELDWLDSKKIVYWGDIDTHGFAILSMLRSRFPSVRSILMDHETLLAHPKQWSRERDPANRDLIEAPRASNQRSGTGRRSLIADRRRKIVTIRQETA